MLIRIELIAVLFLTYCFIIESKFIEKDEDRADRLLFSDDRGKKGKENTDDESFGNADDASQSCLTKNGTVGYCVSYYQCDPDSTTIILDGTTIIDTRRAVCPYSLEVCCSPKDTQDDVSDITTPSKTNPEAYFYHKTISVNEDKMLASSNFTDIETYDQCGWNNHNIFVFPKKDNLVYANYGEFPWMVALFRKVNIAGANDYLGGGAIIHPSVVITVAHKLKKFNAQDIKCRAGEWDMQTDKELYAFQERDVKVFKIHPKYFRVSVYNDVALLFLEKPFNVESSPHIGIACLGRNLPLPDTECFSMGWGANFTNDYKYENILKKVRLPLISASKCQKQLQKSRLGPFFRLHQSFTCAGGQEDVDTCQGDGGSTLVCPISTTPNHTRYVVYGLVAYGLDCGEANKPGVYVNIPNVVNWIDKEMSDRKYGSVTYMVDNS